MRKNAISNKSGFTIVELLGVLVIMSMILLVVFPSTIRLIQKNNEKKYNTYYQMVEKAALAYAGTRQDDLGGSEGKGCIDIYLIDLIDREYIKDFEDDEIECNGNSYIANVPNHDVINLPQEYKDRYRIRIRNNEGKVKVEVAMTCTRNGEEIFRKEIQDTDACEVYKPLGSNILALTMYDKLGDAGNLQAVPGSTNEWYVVGDNPENFVWYSGNLWRVISINTETRRMKLISDDLVSIVTYDAEGATNYATSNIRTWLQTYYLPSLRNYTNMLSSAAWDYSAISSSTGTSDGSNTESSRIGLLSLEEYNAIQTYLNTGDSWWLLSAQDTSNSWFVNDSTVTSAANNSFYGVRPVISLKNSVKYIGGSSQSYGTRENPYRLMGEAYVTSEVKLNTRHSGEYVLFRYIDDDSGTEEILLRVVDTSDSYTKLVAAENVTFKLEGIDLDEIEFSSNSNAFYSGTVISDYLNETWLDQFSEKAQSMLYTGDWCVERVTNSENLNYACEGAALNDSEYKASSIALPKLGELYSVNNSSKNIWTLSKSELIDGEDVGVNQLTPNGTRRTTTYDDYGSVAPALYLNEEVTIVSGKGTANAPFILNYTN